MSSHKQAYKNYQISRDDSEYSHYEDPEFMKMKKLRAYVLLRSIWDLTLSKTKYGKTDTSPNSSKLVTITCRRDSIRWLLADDTLEEQHAAKKSGAITFASCCEILGYDKDKIINELRKARLL